MSRFPALLALVWASLLAGASCGSPDEQRSGGQAGSSPPASSASPGEGSQAKAAPNAARSATGPTGTTGATGTTAPTATKATTVVEQVQASAPAGTRVEPAGVTVAGVELFLLSDGKAPEGDIVPPRLVGVTGGAGGKVLEGRELVRAVIDGKPDRKTLAQVALWAAQDDGQLLDKPTTPEQRKAKVRAPAIARDALTFWVLTTDLPKQLERGTLDLKTGAVELQLHPLPRDVAISNAITTLGSVSISRHPRAIRTLVEACTDPRAQRALLGALTQHPRVKTRVEAADQAHRCGPAAVDGLINAMQHDRASLVRNQAASTLGRIGDSRARPALAKAARGEDANLAWAAGNALKKIR